MKSEWRIASNLIDGRKMYIAYRLLDVNRVDHSGNREYIERSGAPYYPGGYTADRELVKRLVEELNKQI